MRQAMALALMCFFVNLLGFTNQALASCGFQESSGDEWNTKIVNTGLASGRVELLTIPRGGRGPFSYDDYRISVIVLDSNTCQPALSTVWYKDNAGSNHDLRTPSRDMPYHRTLWTGDLGRPQFGVLRLRAWRSKERPLTFVISYQAAPLGPSSQIIPPLLPTQSVTVDETVADAGRINISLQNVASSPVSYEVTDVVCNQITVYDFEPWQVVQVSICTDGSYGKIIYRDVRNATGVEAALIRSGTQISM
jgi:hypothetical protein